MRFLVVVTVADPVNVDDEVEADILAMAMAVVLSFVPLLYLFFSFSLFF